MPRIFVKAVAGRIVPLPSPAGTRRRVVPAEGMWVEHDTFTARRLRDGDLVLANPPAQSEEHAQ